MQAAQKISRRHKASMKVPPKRKGNRPSWTRVGVGILRLNESPSEKEGKFSHTPTGYPPPAASMKVPPKRKGNYRELSSQGEDGTCLNESPSEKEGKLKEPAVLSSHLRGLNESPSEKEGK